MSKPFVIAVDFDGTIVEHQFPKVGAANPGAVEWLRKFADLGARLILWTMRSDGSVRDAVRYCGDNGVPLWSANQNPEQSSWTESPKAYAHLYIDDAAFGCPLIPGPESGRPMVDWSVVGPKVEEILRARN